jgi:uncharacterized protein
MIRPLILSAAFALCILSIPATASAQPSFAQPSFDCAKATQLIEKTICADPNLAEADKRMGQLYTLAQTSAFGKGSSNQLSAQRGWVTGRDTCTKLADSSYTIPDCLMAAYRERNSELAVAVLLDHPAIALASLQKDVPQLAPFYEALQLYMTKAEGAAWSTDAKTRDKIVTLLRPYFAELAADPNKDYGNSVLTGMAKSAEDSVTSDAKLAAALSIMSIYIDVDSDRTATYFPCSALIRRPEMVSAIEPYFGSTLDNFLMNDDCENTLPPQPQLAELRRALNSYWKDDCGGGTIRFAVYRSFAAQVTSAQIGQPIGDTKAQPLSRKGLKPKLVTAALAELADQYQRYRGLSKTEAEQRAKIWLGALISDAGKCYDE